ncbi:MAG: hypothetical protein K6E32_07735 [Lachnospiraceae bacterium]|nr:hypothetical protein [Lachnospiraceae bacterium]
MFWIILLKTLKIIGIILLCILGLILFLLLSVLLVPVRYKGKGEYSKDKTDVELSASWFLHIVRVSFTYGIEEPLRVRIIWFDPLKNKEKKQKPPKSAKAGKRKKKKPEENWDLEELPEERSEAKEEAKQPEEHAKSEEKLQPEEPVKAEDSVKPEEQAMTEEPAKPEIPEATERADKPEIHSSKPESKKSTQSSNKYDRIKRYIELFRSREFKNALSLSFDSIIKVLKHILPRHWQIDAELGFESPDTLGTVLGIAGMFYPLFHRHLNIYPDFDEEIIHVKGHFKGHITLIRLLIIGLKVLFDKDIKKVLKMFKEA